MNKINQALTAGIMLVTLLFAPNAIPARDQGGLIDWQSWSPEIFEQAARENKFVLLNLEAVWCHWCHVMDQETYAEEDVASVLRENYVAVKVDHDARPDLANRYREYGWPATIIFASDGREIAKRAGFIDSVRFSRLLRAVVADPSSERAADNEESQQFNDYALLGEPLYAALVERHENTFDEKLGGYKAKKKTLDRDSTEYAMTMAAHGDADGLRRARKTIDASIALIDTEWGGAYQYSTHGDWQHPHFEKIMAVQAGFLRIYSLAYQQWAEPRYLQAALDIERYLAEFLTSPDGAFYTSQDADLIQGSKSAAYFALSDTERRSRGIPRIDKNVYSRENGWAIEAMAHLYQATGDREYLQKGRRAADWIIANRSIDGGGFRHASRDAGGPYLADTLNMGRAFVALYAASGERRWLRLARSAAEFIDSRFRQASAGYLSGAGTVGPVGAVPNIDENVSATRFLNLMHHYTGDTRFRDAAEHGMRYLATPRVATRRIEEGGVLLAALEMSSDPAHFTVIGSKDDLVANALYDIAIGERASYKRIEWWDTVEGPLPNPDVRYPTFEKAAAFVCTAGRCSLPAFEPDQYRDLIARLSK